ncbi:MAG TPA: metalloregulator ArsR/SmtB family transcription factor [Candidatus Limnocylindria bacterium]|nr:metalloregulator ArsR/SmtB family transcription factor [Candidatus Limnocylindria bacterium]
MTMPLSLIEDAARQFALLADPTRLRLLHELMEQGEMSVGRLAAAADTSRFNASAHLTRLLEAGVVARRREGTSIYYRVQDRNLPRVCEWVCESVRARARAAARAAEVGL